ncbi:MAG: ABC transporter permease subunit [Methylacidiphilales bacterium]|nr:ABC transporter permease subunit [Candidatus Methylacidiphilales bacterium]
MTGAFWTLLKRELGAVLSLPLAYVIYMIFYFVIGFSFLFCTMKMAEGVLGITVMQIFFMFFYYWFVVILLIPILTMRLFSEEYRSGTFELLMTAPVTEWDVVLAKFFGVAIFWVLLWLPTLSYVFIYQWLTQYQTYVDWGALILSYGMTFLLGWFYISIGLFASSLARNQIVAAFTSFAVIALIFFSGFMAFTKFGREYEEQVGLVSAIKHMQVFGTGTFDSRPVVLYLSGTMLFLFLTYMILSYRKLKS